ncbi:MAG: EF-P 5-aminopentanol modification-associated protein YfmF [Dethiobacteria bacterium]|nr:insulinase family protein [Bacillota bacterium]MDW7728604.1 pitrilysin family protein [Bacillota bacterium]
MSEAYSVHYLSNGIRLLFLATKKFKTISLGLFIHRDLKPETVALNALLPSVLEQGCRLYPDYLTLQRHLENLYGSELSTDIIKSGERQIIAFGLESAHDRFLGENGRLLKESLSLLGSVVSDPLLENGVFREDYIRQEKNQLVKDIKALLNDKAAYAMERCLSEMCADEKFGVYKLGRIEDYKDIDARMLYSYYRELLSESPIDLYIIGDLDEAEVIETAEKAFTISRSSNIAELAPASTNRFISDIRTIEEEMTVNQAKMVLGYRTYTDFDDSLHCPLLVYSGVLGGFPHSKLFMKVREEASLAYYIHTRLERHKGLMVIAAGINPVDHDNARKIIDEQLNDMVEGRISKTELDNTRRGLINSLLSRQDSPSQLISFHLDGMVGNKVYTFEELISGIESVSIEDIQEIAGRIKLDTAYLLKPREGEDVIYED